MYVNYYTEGVHAGFPSPADEKYLQNPEATYLVKVVGNSMYPTLQIGDILIVKSDQEFGNDDIGIVSLNQTDFTVKRFNKTENKLVAENNEFQHIRINEYDTLICLGVVKHLIRDL